MAEMNFHLTAYAPQNLPLFPTLHPVPVGRKHLMQDDMRQYAKANISTRIGPGVEAQRQSGHARKAANDAKYKAAFNGRECSASDLDICHTIKGVTRIVAHKSKRAHLRVLALQKKVKFLAVRDGERVYRWIAD